MKNVLASLVLISSLSALADVEAVPSRCDAILRLSDSQKLQIKEISKDTAEKIRALGNDIVKAKLEVDKVLLKVETSKEDAALATHALAAKLSEVQAVKAEEKISVLFDVLTPEQRLKKLKCEKLQQPMHHRGYGPGRIEPMPAPHHRPGRVIRYPAPGRHPHPMPQGPARPRRGGGGIII